MIYDVPAFSSFEQPLTAVVQGASRGIGLALVRQLSANSAVGKIYATARNAMRSDTLQALAASSSAELHLLNVDVTEEASVAAAAQYLHDQAATIDLLINSAGILHQPDGIQPERRLADVAPGNLELSFRVNAVGPLLVAKHFTALLPRDRHTVFASLSARVGSIGDNRLGGWYAYRAAKAAQNQITRTLSIELRRRRPRLVCVGLHPGTVATELSAPFTHDHSQRQVFPPDVAAGQLLRLISRFDERSNGRFYAYDGSEIPW